jgi:type I restriction enzyme S subunit
MAVKAGYQQTEVGVIPQEWEVKFLREVAQIRSGIAKNINVAVTNPIRVHYLRVANVQDGFLDLSEMNQIEISRGDLQRYAVLPGDVLMNEGGDLDKLGRGAIWQGEFNPCVHQNHVFVVRCGSTVDSTYVNIWSAGSVARRYFLVAGKQTTNLASINKTALGKLPVAVPPLAEQQAIAEALSDVDGLISALDALIAKQRAIKHGAMQELLTGQRRLPGFAGEWEVKTLGEVVDFLDGKRKPIKDSDRAKMQGPYPYYGASGIIDYVNDYLFDDNLILLGEDGENIISRNSRLVFQIVGKVWVNNHAHVLKPKPETDVTFLTEYLESLDFAQYNTGTAQPKLNQKVCSLIPVMFPPLAEQTAIAQILADMDGAIAALVQKRAKTVALKQGMMQALLTGQVRLV